MIPLYGVLEGDTLGLVVLGDPHETARSLADKLQRAASVRVAPGRSMVVFFRGRALAPDVTLAEAGMGELDLFEVRRGAS